MIESRSLSRDSGRVKIRNPAREVKVRRRLLKEGTFALRQAPLM